MSIDLFLWNQDTKEVVKENTAIDVFVIDSKSGKIVPKAPYSIVVGINVAAPFHGVDEVVEGKDNEVILKKKKKKSIISEDIPEAKVLEEPEKNENIQDDKNSVENNTKK